MQIYPAIHINGGKAARLTRGDSVESEIYSENPLEAAAAFKNAGAQSLHLVDLDGAISGNAESFAIIKDIVSETGLFVEAGGGIRNEACIERYLEAGIKRVLLGSAAVENFELVINAVTEFGDKIAVGVDAKDGYVSIHGRKKVTDIKAADFLAKLKDAGVDCVIYTDISKSGTLLGADTAYYAKINRLGMKIIASGGISSLEEIRVLKGNGVYGAILEKALYDGKINLRNALAI